MDTLERRPSSPPLPGNPASPLPLHLHSHQKLDAGALFVLESKGSWLHCGSHLTGAVVGPPLLSLPLALASLGWVGGVSCLVIEAALTFYSSNLLSLVLEHHAAEGRRLLRFRDAAAFILGPRWGRFYVGPLQSVVCYGAVISCIILGGQSMKSIFLLSRPNGSMKLYEFMVIFGSVTLVLAQMPSFHSLRHINFIALVLALAYSAAATAGAIHVGKSSKAANKDYYIRSQGENRMFSIFNGIAIIATSYGNGIIPEIQATLAPPVKGKMFKGLCICYAVVVTTFFSVAISGYWAFGNRSGSTVLNNFIVDGEPLLARWFLLMTNALTLLQVSIVAVLYMQPINEMLESKFGDPRKKKFSARNVVPRLLLRSVAAMVATIVSAMVPFFGDINAVLGVFGILPLNFILPMIFYNRSFRPSSAGHRLLFWVNWATAATFAGIGMVGAVTTVRQIALDAKTYRLFANL